MKYIISIFVFCIILCFDVNAQLQTEELQEQDYILYKEAMNDYNSKYYTIAGKKFEEIESNFIFTPLATKSIIMSMYSYYKAGKYNDSLRMIEYYKQINFDSMYLEYMSYMEILNKYKKSSKSKKDLVLMNELYIDIENMLNNYKYSVYKEDILNKQKVVINNIIKNELLIYNFYINNNNFIGAINHLTEILQKFPQSDYTAEILYRLLILYRHINYAEGINNCLTILQNNYKHTKWYKYAINK